MEHRYSIRKALVLDIELNHLRLGRVRCRTRDVGMGGMLVDTGSFWLPVNSIVKVALRLLDAKKRSNNSQCKNCTLYINYPDSH